MLVLKQVLMQIEVPLLFHVAQVDEHHIVKIMVLHNLASVADLVLGEDVAAEHINHADGECILTPRN